MEAATSRAEREASRSSLKSKVGSRDSDGTVGLESTGGRRREKKRRRVEMLQFGSCTSAAHEKLQEKGSRWLRGLRLRRAIDWC